MKNKKRIRITQAEIEKQRLALLNESKEIKPKLTRERKYHDFWWGTLYCDHQGLAVIATVQDNAMILGKTSEILPMLKTNKIDKEDPLDIIKTVQAYRSAKESSSYHLASGKTVAGTTTTTSNSNRIIFRDNPTFLKLLDELIVQGYGVPTIQWKLKSKGYNIAYATLGRWVKKRKSRIHVR